jgi:predicted ATPase
MPFQYGLSLENFKIFSEKYEFEFAPITILTGANGTGKSTVNQALKLLSKLFRDKITDSNNDINLGSLLKSIESIDVEDKVGEFKNYVNKKNKKDIKISFPSMIEFYPNQLKTELIYSNSNKEFSSGILKEININEKTSNINLFKIYLNEKNRYVYKVNYLLFYKTFRAHRDNFLDFLLSAKEKNRFDDLMNILVPMELNKEYENLKKNVFKDLNVSIVLDDNSFRIQIPEDLYAKMNTIGIQDDFLINSNFIKKKWTVHSDLLLHYLRGHLIFDINKMIGGELSEEEVQDLVLLNHKKQFEEKNLLDDFNMVFFQILSNYEMELGYIDERSSDLITNITRHNLPEEAKNFLNNILLNAGVDIDSKAFDKHMFILGKWSFMFNYGNRLSDFGQEFIFGFVEKIIENSLVQLNNYLGINFFDNSINYSGKRTLNLSDTNSGLTIFRTLNGVQQLKLTEFLKKWLINFEIADDISFEKHEQIISVYLHKKGEKYNLADDGFGVSRILPLLIEIGIISTKNFDSFFNSHSSSTLIIEEPELGLHPALQSKLADLFLDAYNTFNIQTIIETHSEYLIRRYQVLIAQEKMQSNDIQLYYMNSPEKINPGELQVYPINIKSDGSLTKPFGKGFFDESSNLNIALYLKSSNQQN